MLQPFRSVLIGVLIAFAALPLLGHAHSPRPAGVAPLRTFDLIVSTEWDAATTNYRDELAAAGCAPLAEDTYLADLKLGLETFARYFYSATQGQLAIGNISIYTAGEQWEQADIRILANRSYRPNAFIGGIVAAPMAYPDTLDAKALFYPGAILLSRQWDGRGARCGAWSNPEGWRTIAHEWGHYALFLYDEYYNQRTGMPQLCDARSAGFRTLGRGERAPATYASALPSLMSYHYTTDQFSLWAAGAPPLCNETPQTTVYGESNWATIARNYSADGVAPPSALSAGPSDAPPTIISINPAGGSPAQTSASVTLGALPGSRLIGQAYLIRPVSAGNPTPQQIIGQGNLLPNEGTPHRFWGVRTDSADRAAIIVPNQITGERYSFPSDYRSTSEVPALATSGSNEYLATTSSWQPSLAITPVVLQNPGEPFSRLEGLRVVLDECSDKQPVAVEFVYCPAGGICGTPVVATANSNGTFSHTFFPAGGPAPHGYIYAREPFRGAETVTWYQIGGGVGPAHTGGFAPIAEGEVNIDLPQNDSRSPVNDNRVLYSPAQVCSQASSLPAELLGIVSTPYTIQVAIAGPNSSIPWAASHPELRIRLNYQQELLDRLNIDELQLVVIRLNGQGKWQIAPTVGQSSELDWIAAAPVSFSETGETYALGFVAAQVVLPVVMR